VFFPLFPTKDVVHNIDISIVSLSAIPICLVLTFFYFSKSRENLNQKTFEKKIRKHIVVMATNFPSSCESYHCHKFQFLYKKKS
jgi:hypothetical protein